MTSGFWDKLAGELEPNKVERPQLATYDLWGKPPTVFDECAAKTEYDCAEIVRKHIAVDEIVRRFADIKVLP